MTNGDHLVLRLLETGAPGADRVVRSIQEIHSGRPPSSLLATAMVLQPAAAVAVVSDLCASRESGRLVESPLRDESWVGELSPESFREQLQAVAVSPLTEFARRAVAALPEDDEQPTPREDSTSAPAPDEEDDEVAPAAEAELADDDTPPVLQPSDDGDPRDTPPPYLFGEEIDPEKVYCAISIHSVECLNETGVVDLLAFTLFNGANDDIFWAVSSTQKLKSLGLVRAVFRSTVRKDVDEGDVLSTLDDVRKPSDEGRTQLDVNEVKLVPRLSSAVVDQSTGKVDIQDRPHGVFTAEDLSAAEITIGLFLAGASAGRAAQAIAILVSTALTLGSMLGGVVQSGSPAGNAGADSTSAEMTDIQFIAELIEQFATAEPQQIQLRTFPRIDGAIVEAALAAGGKPGDGFTFVEGPSREFSGINGGRYRITLRYERHGPAPQ